MSLFADCREKYTKDAYPFGTYTRKNEDIPKDEISPYWDGNLKGSGKHYVDGYDYCVETFKNAFANIMDVDEVIDDTGFLKNVDEDVINDDRPAEDFPIDEMEKWSKETKIMKLLKDCILEYTEIERNELVTAILEDDAASGTDETTD